MIALACTLPRQEGQPFSRWSIPDLIKTAIAKKIVPRLSVPTLWRWLKADKIKPAEVEAMVAAIERHPNEVKLQEQCWCEARQKARASFYRCRKTYQERHPRILMHGTDKENNEAS